MTPATLKNMSVLIVGAGVTGNSVARFLQSHDIAFDVVDERSGLNAGLLTAMPSVQSYRSLDSNLTIRYDVLILSPGVPRAHPAIAAAIDAGKSVIGDIELFASVVNDPVIAVTGSNGKSTVVSMLAHVLKRAKREAVLCGNIGEPVLDAISDTECLYVIELSSYQLESTESLAPYAAAVLNISDDHMDRYASIECYAQVKRHIYHNAKHIVANLDDSLTHPADDTKAEYFSSSCAEALASLRCVDGVEVLVCNGVPVLSTRELAVPGKHNITNALAVLALLEPLNIDKDTLKTALASFPGLPHRTELVGNIENVRFYNDSKGTNVDACRSAINAMGSPVVLIAGGQGKGADFSLLQQDVAAYVKALVLIGEDRELIKEVLGEAAPVHFADSMGDAVKLAASIAKPGDAVLLSPACASFDMFENFEERGIKFTEAVQAMVA